ncbi:MAG: pirin family protein [Candidatus Obscuribacter sp.]|jgi:redox-sensitive bicupin YhaK (pirin superfamily)|nr:pirin family protein [Candidatus Obscuribacter sp.]MBK9201175.1 pirin family protein [Candidatus Obscuribacter sp.]MBK9621836.1 pirin family protein [Candidatus Obscuribacter sp.]MBK9774574.1 pirin family protein [Candidatus Obscuribacter sp.]
MNTLQKTRSASTLVPTVRTREGAGFLIRRPFPTHALDQIDPFLLLDHLEPVQLAPGQAKGAPDHPHRGFETVTYLLDGYMEHRDSKGNSGLLSPGDVQWMTAGSGVIHSEMPQQAFKERGGILHGFQLWVNLPRTKKMKAPRYQDTKSGDIPVVSNSDDTVSIKVIAGEALGKAAVIETEIPILYLHLTIKPGASFSQPVPLDHNAFIYVISGTALSDGQQVQADELLLYNQDGQTITISASGDEPLSVLLIAGKPLNEPVARYGPFVMNTKEEISQAMRDYQDGTFGEIRHP